MGVSIIRGEEVISIIVEAPPPADITRIKPQLAQAGPGVGKAAGRSASISFVSPAYTQTTGNIQALGIPPPRLLNPRPQSPPTPHSYPGSRPPPGTASKDAFPSFPPPGMQPFCLRPGKSLNCTPHV